MTPEKPHIDPFLFECQFSAFRRFVEEYSTVRFDSFALHPYTQGKEGYKYRTYEEARATLAFKTWKKSEIGSGKIIAAIIDSIEIPGNNLLFRQARYGEKARSHQILYEAKTDTDKTQRIEFSLFRLYRQSYDEESFNEFKTIFGKKYSLIAYLFFLKDQSKYLPIAPMYFDKAFSHLGAQFKTNRCCSWTNYLNFLRLIAELQVLLKEFLLCEVTLLDAHSFAWILAKQMATANRLEDVEEHRHLLVTEREAITKARIGQGPFRDRLFEYWGKCAITGLKECRLLRASHIKPWKKSSPHDRINPYNGLLLSPLFDACFDTGFLSFDDDGRIIISNHLSQEDGETMGLHPDMRLSKVDVGHQKYLAYHRKHIFKGN